LVEVESKVKEGHEGIPGVASEAAVGDLLPLWAYEDNRLLLVVCRIYFPMRGWGQETLPRNSIECPLINFVHLSDVFDGTNDMEEGINLSPSQ